MVVRLGVLIIVAGLCVALEDNHKWDLAVAIGDQVELLKRNGTLVGVTLQQFRNLKALAFDDMRHEFIVSDMDGENDTIYRVQLSDKKGPSPIVPDTPDDVKSIAIDPVTDIIYWTDSLRKRILWTSLHDTSKTVQVLFEFQDERPTGIAIDSCGRKIYWTNANRPKSTIQRSNLDGTEREIIISQDIFMPSGITIDQTSKKIYWGDMGEGIYFRIESSDLDGSNRKIVYQSTHQKPYGIAVYEQMVYWTDVINNALWGLKKDIIGEKPTLLRQFIETPMSLIARSNIKNNPECNEVLSAVKRDNFTSVEFIEEASDSVQCLNGELTIHGCKCSRGFTGARCEINLCHNFCLNGICYLSSEGYPQCKCPLGFIGSRCEHEVCKDFCLNGGRCQPTNNGTWSAVCECGADFSGRRCERVNDVETLCSILCEEGDIKVFVPEEKTGAKCRCSKNTDSYTIVKTSNSTAAQPEHYTANLGSQFTERFKDPVVMASWLLTLLMMFTILGLLVALFRLRLRRPRIKKRIIVNKNVTPLTYRPGQSTEQCEITIENCCNMNICETPCFEPPKLGFQFKKPEEKKTLLASMENGEEIY